MAVPLELSCSLTEAAAAVRNGDIRSVDLVQAALDHVAATDDTVGAFASTQAEAALAVAATLDAVVVADGDDEPGPLHGIPIAVKDVLFTKGVETAANCEALKGFEPVADASVVARLREAGAVIIGKLNTHELAFGVSCPASRNPWDPARMTGGSSGGAAASLASRQIFGALGTDTGGSVRIPSNYCGTTGVKTTRGAVPRDGMHMLSWTYDTVGPMARTAADCRVLLDVIAGRSPHDPYSSGHAFDTEIPIEQLVIGVPDETFFDGIDVDPAVLAVMNEAVETLSGLTAATRAVRVPNPSSHAEAGSTIVFAEAAALLAELRATNAERIGPETRSLLNMGAALGATDLAAAQATRVAFERDYLDVFDDNGLDLLIAPVTPNQVLAHGIDGLAGVPLIPATTQFTFPINGTGLPALSLPGGFAPDGMPIGFQLVGRPFSEHTLLGVGEAYQLLTDHHAQVPPI